MECNVKLFPGGFIFEHVRALELGGADDESNIRLTCKPCAAEKTSQDHAMAAKAKRVKARHLGLMQSKRPLPGGRNSGWKHKMDGSWQRRTKT